MILKPRPFRKLRKGHWATKGLIGFWPFYEGDGDEVLDLSGNKRDSVITGNVSWGPGQFGPVLNGSGAAGDYVDTNWRWTLGTGPFAFSCWYKGTEGTDFAGLIGAAIAGSDGAALMIHNNVATIWINNFRDVGTITINDDVWHHLAITRNGTLGKIYVDGVQDGADKTVDSGTVDVAQNVHIFGWGNDTYNTAGLIDLPMIHNRDLNSSEVALLYREPFIMFERDLIELWTGATSVGAPPVGAAGIMTTNTGFWGQLSNG